MRINDNIRKAKKSSYPLWLFLLCLCSIRLFSFHKHFKFQNFYSSSTFLLVKPSSKSSSKLINTHCIINSYLLLLLPFSTLLCKNKFFSQMGGSGRWFKSLISLRKPSPNDQVCAILLSIFHFFGSSWCVWLW